MSSVVPKNKTLYNKVVQYAKTRFKVWPSAYASGWVVKEYKRRGGEYQGDKTRKDQQPLARWYEQEWINVCQLPKIVPCGRTKASWEDYPYCRPRKRVSASTPKTAGQLSKDQINDRCKKKKSSPRERVFQN